MEDDSAFLERHRQQWAARNAAIAAMPTMRANPVAEETKTQHELLNLIG